jgi:hypothetical protein
VSLVFSPLRSTTILCSALVFLAVFLALFSRHRAKHYRTHLVTRHAALTGIASCFALLILALFGALTLDLAVLYATISIVVFLASMAVAVVDVLAGDV